MNSLFRKEAVDYQSQRYHGAILLTRTWSYPALCIFFCGIILVLTSFAAMFGFTRKETVTGLVISDLGINRLAAPQFGVVTAIHVIEGQAVKAGDPILTISSERSNLQGNTQANVNTSLRTRIDHLSKELAQQFQQTQNKRLEFDQRIVHLKVSLQHVETELALQQRRVILVRDTAARFTGLATSGAVTKLAVSEKAAEVIEQESRLSAIELEYLAIQREKSTIESNLLNLPLQAQREISQIERTIEELKQQISESEAKREVVLSADQDSLVTGIVVRRGQAVHADQSLASLMPVGSQLEVELYAPTRAVGLVHVGTEVTLRYDAFPYQKFGQFRGRVREISLSTIPMNELQISSASTEPVYRLRVHLNSQELAVFSQQYQLKPGMQLNATLVLEHRSLVQWVLEPLYGITSQ